MTRYLMLCQIGPVQAFIAQARRTQDLYVGSHLLSVLASAGVAAAQQSSAQMLFPVSDAHGGDEVSAPHRFAFITEQPKIAAASVEKAVRGRWGQIADGVKGWLLDNIGGGQWESVFDRQAYNWLEFYWVAVEYDGSHGEAYGEVNRAMAQRKNARHFVQIDEPGWKCTLTGAGQALPLDWDQVRKALDDRKAIIIRRNEALGALALIKRLAITEGVLNADTRGFHRTKFRSTDNIAGLPDEEEGTGGKEVEGYFAVLQMDGDQMGAKLSALTKPEQHRAFSQALAQFASQDVPAIVRKYERAELIYAGGDDVLALLPLRAVLACADEIRRAYADKLDKLADKPTMSAGIAVVPSNYPLDIALELARKAEKSAKDDYGRDAVVVTEAHGTQQRIAGAKWELGRDSIAALVSELIQAFSKPAWLSAKIGYDLQEVTYALAADSIPAEARRAEVTRLVKRRTESFLKGKDAQTVIDELAPRLCAWGEAKNVGWESLANWVILARFLASGEKEQS